MLKVSNSPYWKRPQFKALTAKKWDIIIIMLGTNDAKDPETTVCTFLTVSMSWPQIFYWYGEQIFHNCGGQITLPCLRTAEDYASMIKVVQGQAGPNGEDPRRDPAAIDG